LERDEDILLQVGGGYLAAYEGLRHTGEVEVHGLIGGHADPLVTDGSVEENRMLTASSLQGARVRIRASLSPTARRGASRQACRLEGGAGAAGGSCVTNRLRPRPSPTPMEDVVRASAAIFALGKLWGGLSAAQG